MNWATRLFAAALGRRPAQHSGELRLECRARIEIRRDDWGVAYIDARNEWDAWFGLGFCHAQDRAGQLETTLRLVRGTLSSVIGPSGLSVDRVSRLLGVRDAAAKQFETCDADVREQLRAYSAGVNAAFGNMRPRRSHEHVLLRCDPSPWEPADVIAFALMMCCLLPSNWDMELLRLLILHRDGPDAVCSLDPRHARRQVTGHAAGAGRAAFELPLLNDLGRLREAMGSAGGSNAWAVSGQRTANGRPILANDPHLPAVLPNLGYLARVKCPAFAAAGVTMVGAPVFMSGHNGHSAWGSTAAYVDNTDLFLEELDVNGRSAREGDDFVPCSLRSETIDVRGRAAERLDVLTTTRGPIVARLERPCGSIFEPLPLSGRANAISLGATWLRVGPTRALLTVPRVRTFEEFRSACAQSTACAYALVYADAQSIGLTLAVEVPRRKERSGALPALGWEADASWLGVVESADLPAVENPSMGYVCTANNRPTMDAEFDSLLGEDFLDPYRHDRILRQLAQRDDWTVERTAELQLDVTSLPWDEVRPTVLAIEADDRNARRALELLVGWDGRLTSDSAAATVFELFLSGVCQRVCRAKAPNTWEYAMGRGFMSLMPGTTIGARRVSFLVRLIREQPTEVLSNWTGVLVESLRDAVLELEHRFGVDTSAWAWGAVRPLRLKSRFGNRRPLDRVYDVGPLPGGGDGSTVNQAGLNFWRPLQHTGITAHFRAVIEVGNWEASRFVLLGGQSGNPTSDNYANLVPFWQTGAGVPIHWDDASVATQTKSLLVLRPNQG